MIHADRSLAKNSAAFAMSCAVPARPMSVSPPIQLATSVKNAASPSGSIWNVVVMIEASTPGREGVGSCRYAGIFNIAAAQLQRYV